MLSPSDVWKLLDSRQTKRTESRNHALRDYNLMRTHLERQSINKLIQSALHPNAPQYDPPLRAHEYYRLSYDDKRSIDLAISMGLIPDSGDCRVDLAAVNALPENWWESDAN